ncbi:hypothetical protein DTO012A9_10338 [Penicillium roqueforti]|nr:hypothetical protein DTO012A9_10338 [Penicillium roqueforti]
MYGCSHAHDLLFIILILILILILIIIFFFIIILLKLNANLTRDIPPVTLSRSTDILDELESAAIPQHDAESVPSRLRAEQNAIVLICTC